jgi:peptidoglycan/xylan/chitin deacetylase (PgdA/CDA1 family)
LLLLVVYLALTSACDSDPFPQWSRSAVETAVAPARAGKKLTPAAWPNGARVAVCLTFDVDNETLTLAGGSRDPVALSAGEFGAVQGLPRVLALLDKHDVPATFFVPVVSAMLHPDMLGAIGERARHEIGVHGWFHESYRAVNDRSEEKRLITESIEYLTEKTGRRPVGFRAPSWTFSRYTPSLIRETGFLYDSSLMAMDEPYEMVSDGQPTGVVELPVDWLLDDHPYLSKGGSLPSPKPVFRIFRDEFDVAYAERTLLVLTMHPHVSGHRSRALALDRLIAYMKSKPGVWFATAAEVAEYVKGTRKD